MDAWLDDQLSCEELERWFLAGGGAEEATGGSLASLSPPSTSWQLAVLYGGFALQTLHSSPASRAEKAAVMS